MPTTPITQDFTHPTCRISVEGKTLTADRIAELTSPVSCTIELGGSNKPHTFEGDGETLHDLVTTIDRYLKYLLSSQLQGTFSGSVAIRPLDAVRHRITLKQGNGVGQADLTTTQLYDLAESLGEIDDAIPQLARLKTRPQTVAWYRRPAASVAALAIVGVGVVATSLVLTRPGAEDLGNTEFRVDESISQLAEPPLDPSDSIDPTIGGDPELPDDTPAPASESSSFSGIAEDEALSLDRPPAEAQSPRASVLEGIEEQTDAVIPSEIGSGDIRGDVDVAGVDAANEVASAELDDSERSPDAVPSHDASSAQRSRQLASSSLEESWQAPTSLTEPVEYDLTIAEDGTLLTAVPVDERAVEIQAQTPFADLPETSEQEGIQVRVALAPDNTVTVTVPPQADAQ